MTVYVYHDEDHGTIKVYEELDKAFEQGWGEDDDEENGPWHVAYVNKKTREPEEWCRGEYCFIYKREVL